MTGIPEPSADAPGKPARPATYAVRVLIIIAVMAVLVVIGGFIRNQILSTDQLFQRAEEALRKTPQPDFEAAEGYLRRILDREPDSNRANLLMAVILVRQEELDEAIKYTERIVDDGSPEAVRARCLEGDLLLHHRLAPSAALEQYQRAFAQDLTSASANTSLAQVYGLGVRTREMTPYSVYLAKSGLLAAPQLYELSLGYEAHADPNRIEEYELSAPDDPIVLLGEADVALTEGRFAEAETHFRRVIRDHPEILAAQVRLGQVYLESGDAGGFYQWNSGLPAEAERHPLTWSIRGHWAEQVGAREAAIRCYWECVRIDPNHLPAVYRLGQLLTMEKRGEDALPFLHRAFLLDLYTQQALSLILLTDQQEPNLNNYFSAVFLSAELGLLAEASAWIKLIQEVDGTNMQAQRMEEQLRDPLAELTTQRAAADANPAGQIDLSEYPLPDWSPTSGPALPRAAAGPPTVVTFENQAADAGLDFQFSAAGDGEVRGLSRVWCVNGGGVAILDLDCDGWPDIHLTQGADVIEPRSEHRDQLYRNTGQGRFQDVTGPARIVEEQYSQGAAVGDFNGDGFPDLRIANIGGNRLFQNNGDGTFEDVSESCGVVSGAWTTSCVQADLNGDGLPDLYDVNYLSGDDLFSTVCRDAKGRHHACQPLQFLPSQDELFLNRGDGTFDNATAESGIVALNGRGLGIVAGDFDGSGKLNLFIANASGSNFYFVNEGSSAPKFTENGVRLGAACNREGRSESSRGVAAGDVDLDGQLELFVTSAWSEPNALYDWQPEQLFLDNAPFAGLAEPGRASFGFGAQFIDGALRGELDLIVTSGHVDAYDIPGVPYEMPPQYLSNIGGGRFAQLEGASVGPYFEGAYLGRSLALIDWNRDGREDVVVSHLDAPAALLTNTTEGAGRYATVRLIGTQTARDAIGTTLTLLTDDGRTLVRQLTAGDGFQASNQRIITFGLGDAGGVEALRVRWPSGIEERFTDIEPDRRYLCVEGTNRLYGDAP